MQGLSLRRSRGAMGVAACSHGRWVRGRAPGPRVCVQSEFVGERELLSNQGDDQYRAGEGGCQLLVLPRNKFNVRM